MIIVYNFEGGPVDLWVPEKRLEPIFAVGTLPLLRTSK
jgi:hypothetical protein